MDRNLHPRRARRTRRSLTSASTRLIGALALVMLAAPACAQSQRIYFGLLHAHTCFSDGSGTPAEAYAMARSAGLDFFAVTPHNHDAAESGAKDRTDGVLIATNPALYNSEATLSVRTADGGTFSAVSVRRAAREAITPTFLALYGQEFSTISSGNHVNVFGAPDVLSSPNGNFRALFDMLASLSQQGVRTVVQLNHPNVQKDLFYAGNSDKSLSEMYNDYGFDDFGEDFESLVASSDRHVALVEMLSGPAMSRDTYDSYRYAHVHENDYYYYLVQGFHVSPSAGQDNHYPTWGRATPARTGVLADALTQEAIFRAMHENRTFATEDKNLSVTMRLNGSMMGSCLTLAAGADVAIDVDISDADESESVYEATLYYGDVAPQTRGSLERYVASDGETETLEREGNGVITFAGYVASGEPEFFYVRVTQDGEDRAWTAPVWINHPRDAADLPAITEWVWTSNESSRVYHHAWCKVCPNIAPHNRRTGSTPPDGRTVHACQRPAERPEH